MKSLTVSTEAGERGAPALQLAWALTLSLFVGSDTAVFKTTAYDKPAATASSTIVPVQIHLDLERTVAVELDEIERQSPASHPSTATGDGWVENSLLVLESPEAPLFDIVRYRDYPLVLGCRLVEREFQLQVGCNDNGPPEWLSSQLLHHFAFVLHNVIAHPETKLIDLPTISSEDYAQVLEWNHEVPINVRARVQDLIAKETLAHPESPAVCAWDGDFTYQELDTLSSHLAAHLTQLGVGPETFVPIVFEKSKWNMVATLGIIKAGGAFVPLDPGHPIPRLQEICRQTKAKVTVASSQTAPLATSLAPVVVRVGEEDLTWRENDGIVPEPSAGPDNALYAIFTSGTTGRPKGAVLEHRQFCSIVGPMMERTGLNRDSRAFQFSSHAFDLSVSDILATLVAGGCVCIPSDLDRTSNLAGSANTMKVNIMTTTPSVHRLFNPADVPTLKTIISCGEMLTAADLEHWRGIVRNCWGPVETSIICTGNITPPDNRNIGTAFGCRTWVVDRHDHRRLLPIGAVGEVLVEGAIVARGYLNEPEKTAEVFVERPSWIPGGSDADELRQYRTGDLARYNGDGTLHFVERKDTQVKLHGNRIELAEVEHHLQSSFQTVDDVIVDIASPPARGNHQILVAFVLEPRRRLPEAAMLLPVDEEFRQACTEAEEKLRSRVPSYMVPGAFIPVSRMPLTLNGKIDRRNLREAAAGLSKEALDIYAAKGRIDTQPSHKRQPQTDREVLLQKLVAESIEAEPSTVGMEDNFFFLGGDSTTAMKLVSLAREAGIFFTVPDLVSQPRLVDLLAFVDQQESEKVDKKDNIFTKPAPFSLLGVEDAATFFKETLAPQLPDFALEDVLDAFPMTAMQKRFYGPPQYYQLFLQGEVDQTRLKEACEQLMKDNAILRAIFVSHNEDMIQVIPKRSMFSFDEVECEEPDLAEYVQKLCQEDVAKPIPLGQAPTRFTFVKRSPTENVLIIRITHSQYDGVTLPIIYRRLAALYRGEPTPIVTDFPEYLYRAETLKTPAATETWKDILQNASMSYVGLQQTPPPEPTLLYATRVLPNLKPAPGITQATLVKAAWALTLSSNLECRDVTFAQMVNGRGVAIPGIESILGPCFNTIPVRVPRQKSWTGLDLLHYVQSQHLKTMPYSSLGFEEIKKLSTGWDPRTTMASVVVHQHFEQLKAFDFADGIHCTVKDFFAPTIPNEIVLYSEVNEAKQWELHLLTSVNVLGPEAYDGLLGKTAEYMKVLAATPEKELTSIVGF
ncbi:amino acid adenylation [Aspergillus saccharolyticus JOP 1030-1]|uniref:Amino acid adenylation n=1 Tax=Aspergillus saccharolyticus JOP 1030-1 TaxID=1450539 RepID=A0A318ZJE9_9EURO|nr:amino acid adenylation [Aspergillus saccharolyticus JOP 1030-1]PYH46504.1 amino acid adenylation [Aspergillus saccharolyticus JOP 1030-1]